MSCANLYRWCVAGALLLVLGGCRAGAFGEGGEVVGGAATRERVDLLAMGDWGTGREPQRRVANALAAYVHSARDDINGMLLAGDNFYVRLSGTDDPQWQTLFEQMYDPQILDFPFYASLGNHDYEQDKAQVQLAYARENPESRWTMPAQWYRVDFPADKPLVTVFMLDSNRPLMSREVWHAQNQWLRDQLREGNLGEWVLAVAHHPLFSNGSHGDNGVLQRTWGPIFEEYGVDFYVCGHDHDLQHLQIDGWNTSFVLCGGGGAGTRPMRNDRRGPFSRSLHGFAHFTFTPESTVVRYIDVDGALVHLFERDRDGQVRVIETTGRDTAQPRTVRSITRPDTMATEEEPAAAPAQ